jgi:aminoglycoside phosphotransferase (APT) family kinase protein
MALDIGDDQCDRPSAAFIAGMERRYPVEAEINKFLVRKMQRRADGPFNRCGLDEIQARLARFLTDTVTADFEISNVRWLNGGASKLQIAFDLAWQDPIRGRSRETLVLRMEPSEALNANSRLREYELLSAFKGVVPVPEVYFLDEDGDWFPEPTLVYSFERGVTKPRATQSGKLAGLGTEFGRALRDKLAPQFVEYLTKIHTFDHIGHKFSSMDRPETDSTQSALWQLNRARRVWEEDSGESIPLMAVASNWLEHHLPTLDAVSVVHGDYRSGNFLFDEESARMTAWLDWERGHLGDRHRDLAWTTQPTFGHFDTDGKTYLVCGLIPIDEFYRQYEALSGLAIDADKVLFYRILNSYQLVVTNLATAYRVARLGKSHQDVLLARLRALAPAHLRNLSALLAERV